MNLYRRSKGFQGPKLWEVSTRGAGDQRKIRAILVKFVKLIPLGDSGVTLGLSGETESQMEIHVLLLGK